MLYPSRMLMCLIASGATLAGSDARSQEAARPDEMAPQAVQLFRAARSGDVAAIETSLREGADPNVRDQAGRTPLLEAVAAGKLEAARVLLQKGASANVASSSGRTPLVDAAEAGRADAALLLIEAGADLNRSQRGVGSPLEAAERAGHNKLAAMLLRAGARSSGRSVGDTVCVRPWAGDGYCGVVEGVQKTVFTIRVTDIVGCDDGCPAKADCSPSRPVGGTTGVQLGDVVDTVSWCLTHTGVQP